MSGSFSKKVSRSATIKVTPTVRQALYALLDACGMDCGGSDSINRRNGESQDRVRRIRGKSVPFWDGDPINGTLWFGDKILKQLGPTARDQRAILDAFQKQRWKQHILSPLHSCDGQNPKVHLRETIRALNKGLPPGLMRFYSDGTGGGIIWRMC